MKKPTILMTLSDLEIGGAQTHVVTLSKNLKEFGYDIIVASSGGVYEKELDESQIKHYKININSKKPWNVILGLFKLIKIVKSENIDIIHSHARIPATISRIVSNITGVKFITTAHAKFRSNLLLRMMSSWGEKTIAVSDDIKVYLEKTFKVKSEKITIITNGIDTERFKPGIDYSDLMSELKIGYDYTKIVWVSRLDDQLGETALNLVDAADLLNDEFGKLAIIIVGGGNQLKNISKRAERKNRELEGKFIHVIGPRTDINKIMNLASVFVGISRAALEAAACEKPVVLAGPWSFVGVLNEENIKIGRLDNFTGRNSEKPVNSQLLAKAIFSIMHLRNEDKDHLGKLGRELVVENYSGIKMAEQTIKVYKGILNIKGEKENEVN